MERDVLLFTTDAGQEPFSEFLRSIKDKNVKSQMLASVTKMSKGLFGDYKAVGSGVQECRLHSSGHRIYFYFDGPVMVILLGGSDKKTQSKEIEKAKENLKEYKKQKTKMAKAVTAVKKGNGQ